MADSPFILASQSESRKKILRNAAVDFVTESSRVDESPIKRFALQDGKTVEETALLLAYAKAADVSGRHEDALVLGADQMLECENVRFDKASSKQEALAQLRFLRGKTHRLITAVVLVRNSQKIWEYIETASLKMREFSEEFLEAYCNSLGAELVAGVGGYAIEGKGVQLMENVKGDFFGILGLPLLPVLAALRKEGALNS